MPKKKKEEKNKKIKTEKRTRKISIRKIFSCRDNLARGIVITVLIIALLLVLALVINLNLKKSEEKNNQTIESSELEIPVFDTTDWENYQNNWYGFKLKYPENWEQLESQKPLEDSRWEYKYRFRKKETDEDNPYIGFDVVIYNINKVKELTSTEEHPSFKFEMNENETCRFIPEHMKEEPAFFSVEMHISPADDCYNQAFFYSIISDKYIYNVAPVPKDNQKIPTDFKKYAIKNFPEFISTASSFDLITIKKINSQPITQKPAVRLKKCPAKVDNPSISSRNDKNHMDEDCCPDFDEWPKPGCAYSAKDYVIMLKNPTNGHVKSSRISKVKTLLREKD